MILADCGSCWAKIWNSETNELQIVQTKDIIKNNNLTFDFATGHSGKPKTKRYENELIALAEGALSLISDDNFTIVDVGSRDTKYIVFKNRKIAKIDWNLACGSSTGATVELLGHYYDIDFNSLEPSDSWVPVTCGVFGIERILELIAQGYEPERGISMFIHGVVRNIFTLVGEPEKLYLSGGFCENICFIKTLNKYCEVLPIGRTVLIRGLYRLLNSNLP